MFSVNVEVNVQWAVEVRLTLDITKLLSIILAIAFALSRC